MIDDKDYTATSLQSNGKGALARIEGACKKPGQVTFVATLGLEKDRDSALGLPDFANGYLSGNKRINDDPAFSTRFPSQKFRNSILVATLSSGTRAPEEMETTWRILAEIETSQGRIVIQIPMFNSNVQKMLTACAKQYENAIRRGGVADAPTSLIR